MKREEGAGHWAQERAFLTEREGYPPTHTGRHIGRLYTLLHTQGGIQGGISPREATYLHTQGGIPPREATHLHTQGGIYTP